MPIKAISTTLKLETCAFSEEKIYPGRARNFVRKDGKVLTFINTKCKSLNSQKIKSLNVRWTSSWRKAHKKDVSDNQSSKKRSKTNVRTVKAISGMSLDAITEIKAKAKSNSSKTEGGAKKHAPLASKHKK